MMKKFRDPWEMFWSWVLGRALVHMPSKLTREPRLDGAVIAVPVLDVMLVKRSHIYDEAAITFRHQPNCPLLPKAQTKHRATKQTPRFQGESQDYSTTRPLTQKVISLMILRPPTNLNTLQTIVNRALPALQLQPCIRAVGEKQRIAGEALAGLGVKFLGGLVVAFFERLVALLFESVGGGLRHSSSSEAGAEVLLKGRRLGGGVG